MKKINHFFKKSVAYTLALQLSCAPLMATHLEDDLIRAAKPSREFSLVFTDAHRQSYGFTEYYLGSNGNNCFFNALGVTREDAVDKVMAALNRGSARTQELLDKAIADQAHERAFDDIQDLPLDEKRAAYLDIYRSGSLMIECAQKIGQMHDVADNVVTLFNVFAYVYRRNISVYTPNTDTGNRLNAFHITRYADCTAPTLHLLLKGSHFNKLIPNQRSAHDHEAARMEEDHYLKELRARIQRENDPSCLDDQPQPTLPMLQVGTSAVRLSSLSQPPLPVADDAPQPQASTPSSNASSSSAPARMLSRDQIVPFLLKKTPSLSGHTYNASCKATWNTLSTWLTSYEKFAGQATLLLDHGFTPQGEERASIITTLLSQVPRLWLTKSEQHQINLYLGRLHLAQGDMKSAWSYFKNTIDQVSFSQIGRLYMAQMIIDQDFRPAHLANPIAYAQSLLEPIGHASKSGKRTVRTGDQSNQEAHLHNPYLNQSESHQTADSLKRRLSDTRHHQEARTQRAQTSRAPSASASRASAARVVRDDPSSSSTQGARMPQEEVSLERVQKKQRHLSDVTPAVQDTPPTLLDDAPFFVAGGHDESPFFTTACPAPQTPAQDDVQPSSTHTDESAESDQDSSFLSLNNDHPEVLTHLESMLLQAKAVFLDKNYAASIHLYHTILERLQNECEHLRTTHTYKNLKTRSLIELARNYSHQKLESSTETAHGLYKQALVLALEMQDPYLQATIYKSLGETHPVQTRFEANSERFHYYEEAFKIYQAHGHVRSMIEMLKNMGLASAPRDAIAYFDEGLGLCSGKFSIHAKIFRNYKNRTLRMFHQQ